LGPDPTDGAPIVQTSSSRVAVAALLVALTAGCSTAPRAPAAPSPAPAAPEHRHAAEPAAAPPAAEHAMHAGHAMHGDAAIVIPQGALYTAADVRFMQGMIAHHAQAIHMSRLAVSRGADARLLRFANKIDQSQMAEIRLMQEWLRAHGQMAPDTSSWRTMTMAGMLTPEQLARLEGARGVDFDRLFLTYMIQHHEGALSMVAALVATPRAAQDVDVSVFANDVETVQTAEIALMRRMLAAPSTQSRWSSPSAPRRRSTRRRIRAPTTRATGSPPGSRARGPLRAACASSRSRLSPRRSTRCAGSPS
jgi:uncharacterized protein (DUF305 family)